MYELEDNDLLRGQIAIIGLEKPELFKKFSALFQCKWDLVDCALMSQGNYMQCERNGWRYQGGSHRIEKSWIQLFHKSSNQGFEDTKDVLHELLNAMDSFSNEALEKRIEQFISECEDESIYEWMYYYVKYPSFRPGRYGKYSWTDLDNGCYDMHVLWTESKWSENSYDPFLYEVDAERISRDDLGRYLIFDEEYIECINDGFVFYSLDTDEETRRLEICRDDDIVDKEDRIAKLKKFLVKR